ncbi:MAG: mechanosensitive ion channel family protein [Trichodesmium sp.]
MALLTLLVLQTSLMANPVLKTPLAPPDTSSPQGTISSFVENINQSYQILMPAYERYQEEPGLFPSKYVRERARQAEIFFKRAERCLNLSKIPSRLKQDKGLEATLMLKGIFDRIEIPAYDDIPDSEIVSAKSKFSDEFSKWTIPNTEIDIVKVEEGVNEGEFLFSPETVARIEEFYKKVEALPYKPGANGGFYKFYISTPGSLFPPKWLQIFPSWLDVVYWDQTLWQWIGLVISLSIGFWVCYRSFHWNWQRVSNLDRLSQTWELLIPPVITIVSVVGISYFLNEGINITGQMLLIILTILEVIFWIVVGLTIFLFGNALAETIIASPKISPRSLNASMIRTVCRLLSLTIGTTILILGIERVGISIVPLIAGVGIGGLAFALAARPTIENLIAGVILLADRPVKVGEYCRFGDEEGTILEIGLRSTRILSINGDLLSIPNSQFSELKLANKTRRDRILLRQTIGLRYETTSDQLRFVLTKFREMILAHPKLLEQGARVRLIRYNDYSRDVEIFVYVDTGKLPEFLAIQEDVLLRVDDIVESSGTGFAFPSQTNYISQDSGLEPERSRAAEAEVKLWRSKGSLPFPDLSTEQRDRLRDTLDFPPKGSPNASSVSD